MKIRNGFVSNSSSTSFVITNTSMNNLTLLDFVNENPKLVELFNEEYGHSYTQFDMEQCAESRNQILFCGENIVGYGDEDGDILGQVYDYILRNGGESKSFSWSFKEYNR